MEFSIKPSGKHKFIIVIHKLGKLFTDTEERLRRVDRIPTRTGPFMSKTKSVLTVVN